MRLRDLKIGAKQRIGFGIILVIMAAVNIYAIQRMLNIKTEIDEVSHNWLPRAVAISDLNLNTAELRIQQLQHVLASDETEKLQLAGRMIELIDEINKNRDTFEQLSDTAGGEQTYSEEQRRFYRSFDDKWDEYQSQSLRFFALLQQNQRTEAIELLTGDAQAVFRSFSADLVRLVNANKNDSFAAAARADKTFRSTRNLMIILLIVTILLTSGIANALIRFITIPIKQLERAASEVAQGILDAKLAITSRDEIGSLSASFNMMTQSLRDAHEKTEQQAAKLREQHEQLQVAHGELEYKNADLQRALRQLKSTQEELVMKEKMAALGNLIAGIAHEINNPIGTVNAAVDVSQRCVTRIENVLQGKELAASVNSNPRLVQALDLLKKNVAVTLHASNRVATLVQTLKNFVRVDEAAYKIVNIHEGLESSLTLLRSELGDWITVTRDFGDLPRIRCYPSQLNQVFLSVLKNAVDAIDGPGAIHICTEHIDSRIRIRISDTGRGIPPDKLASIFDFGFSSTASRVKLRSGLSTAYHIIQHHNGEIIAESREGKGTTITIWLPVS